MRYQPSPRLNSDGIGAPILAGENTVCEWELLTLDVTAMLPQAKRVVDQG
jgi:hypothetical protein